MTEMLQIDTVAEGIETQKQLDYFIQTKCRYLQGYFFSKPVSAAVSSEFLFEKWLGDAPLLTDISSNINSAS